MLDAVAIGLGLEQTADAPFDIGNIRITVTRESPSTAADIANATGSSCRAVINDVTNGQSSVSALREAAVPEDAVWLNTQLHLALGLLVSPSVGSGLAVLREVLEIRVCGQQDVGAIANAPISGGFGPGAIKRPLIV